MPATDSEIIVNVLANITGLKTGLSQAEAAVKQASAQMQAMGEKGSASMQMISMSAEELAALLQAVVVAARKTSSEVKAMGEAHRTAARKVDELALAEKVFGKTTAEAVRAARGYVSALRGMGEAMGIAALFGFVQHLANTAQHMEHLARASGMSVADLAKFSKVMEEAGVPTERIERALPRFAEHVWMAAQGAKEQQQALQTLGISMDYVREHGNNMHAMLMALADSLHKHQGSTETLAAAYLLLGRNSESIVGALMKGKDAVAEAEKKYQNYANELQKSVEAANELKIAETALWAEVEAAGFPVLRKLPELLLGVYIGFQYLRVGVIAFREDFRGLVETWKVFYEMHAAGPASIYVLIKEWDNLKEAWKSGNKPVREALDSAKEAIKELKDEMQNAHTAAEIMAREQMATHDEYAEKLAEIRARVLQAARFPVHADLKRFREEQEAEQRKALRSAEEFARQLNEYYGETISYSEFEKKLRNLQFATRGFAEQTENVMNVLAARPEIARPGGMDFGIGTAEEQLRMAEAMMEHVRAMYEAGKISYQQMATEQVNILEEMHRQQLISDQEYARRSLRLQDELLRGQSKEMGDRFSEGFAQALVEGMTGREPHSLSIALYNWFAKSWNSAIEKFITSGISFLMNLLRSKLGAVPGEGGLFGGLLGVFTARKPVRTPPFFPTAAGTEFSSLVAPARAAGMQSAHAFGDAFSSQLAHLPITRSVSAMMSGVTSAVAASSRTALSQQKSIDRESKLSSAKTAAAHVFKSVAAIPIVGWIMAPGAAAAAFATVMAFQKGGIVPETGLALVHKNELVLPSHLANDIRNAVRAGTASGFPGGAGNVHFHYSATVNALDSRGVEDVLSQHGRTIVALLEKQIRSKNWA